MLAKKARTWNHEQWGVPLAQGMDEVSLAQVADAWSRTYRSRAFTFASSGAPVVTANGIRILPDRATPHVPPDHQVPVFASQPPAHALDGTLVAIARRYGERTTDVVAMQLEYPR